MKEIRQGEKIGRNKSQEENTKKEEKNVKIKENKE